MIRTNRSTFSNTLGTQRKRYLIGVVVLVGLMSLFRLETLAKFQDAPEKQGDNLAALLRLDKTVRPVTFLDTKGGKSPLLEQKEAKAIVVAFLDFKCPISNRYVPILNELVEKYSAKGVVVAAVICDVESPEELDRHAKEFRTGFKVFYDPTHILSNHFLADTAPQVYLLDQDKILRYFGAIDDQYQDRTTRLREAKTPHLVEAIEEILAKKQVTVKHAQAIGCPLGRLKKEVITDGKVTFYKDVLPLLQNHCQICHRPGDVAPFSLLTFEDALNWSDDMKDYVASKKMPPWPIRGGLPLKNDRSLSEVEIATISQWVDSGCAKGDIKDSPKPVIFAPKTTWEGDTPPDIIVEMDSPFHLAAKGEDHYRMIAFPLNNKDELNIHKVQFIPGNKRIVHHELTFYDGTDMVIDAQKRLGKSKPTGTGDEDYGPGYESGMGLGFEPNAIVPTKNKGNPGSALGVWVPGQGPMAFPPKSAAVIPPESAILMQIHYHRNGKQETDKSKIGIWLTKEKPEKYVNYMLVDTNFRWIPKGVSQYKSIGSKVVEQDCEAYLFKPHMHFLGQEIRVWHQPKNSKERKLLFDLKNWDYNWQSSYYTKEYYFLEKGSTLHVEAVFDNSARNSRNLFSPPRNTFLGEGDEDEMGYVSVSYMSPNRPDGRNEFMNYFIKLREGALLKKTFGNK